MGETVRESCPICFKQHVRAARKYYYEMHKDPAYFEYAEDPHMDGFMEEIEHAEQQCPFPQLFMKIRRVKKAFEDVDTLKEFFDVSSKENWWETLTKILVEVRELRAMEKLEEIAALQTATQMTGEIKDGSV